ncbi:MAG: DsbA family protein [Flavobacteriales bacterium]
MTIEIWSDIACPFCYIGKKRFEKALEKFPRKNEVTVIWKSFQLDPDFKPVAGESIHQMLADKKGWTLDYAIDMNNRVSKMAADAGLTYNFDKTIPANTFNAHRLIQFAASEKLQNEAEEKLFSAYFCEGKNINDLNILIELGKEIGLKENQLKEMFADDSFTDEVYDDMEEAGKLGINSVPFFVGNRKIAVAGAQPEHMFTEFLEQL